MSGAGAKAAKERERQVQEKVQAVLGAMLREEEGGRPSSRNPDMHKGWVWSFCSEGDTLVSGSWDNTVRLWTVAPAGRWTDRQHDPAEHRAQSTEHGARSTEHGAQRTEHGAQSR